MQRLLKFELLKLKYSRSFKVMIFISLLFGFISAGISIALSQGPNITGHEAFFQQFTELRSLIFVLTGAFSGLFIGEDFSTRTVQAQIASGYSRFSILLSKTIVYMIGICVLIVVQVSIATFINTLFTGFGIPMTINELGNMLRAVLMFMFLTCACSTVYVMTSFWFKNIGTTIAVNMVLLVVIDGFFQVGAMLSNFGMKIYEFTPFVQILISSAEIITSGQLIKALALGSAISVIFFVLTYTQFYKAELK